MAKRTRYSRWRRLPGGLSRTSQRLLPDYHDEPQRLIVYLPGSLLDAAEEQAKRLGPARLEEYCAGLLRRAIEEQAARDHLAEVEARGGSLEGLQEIANDPEYLAEWNAEAARREGREPSLFAAGPSSLADGDATPSGFEGEGAPDATAEDELPEPASPEVDGHGVDAGERPPALAEGAACPSPAVGPTRAPAEAGMPGRLSASGEVVLRHTSRIEDGRANFLASLRRGEAVGVDAVAELARALRDLEAEHGGADAVDRRLAFALHRLAFEGQVHLTDSWPGTFDNWTVDALRAVQEAVDRILSGRDIRYYATDSRPENLH